MHAIFICILVLSVFSVADPEIDKRGGGEGANFLLTTPATYILLYDLEWSCDILHRKMLKSKASSDSL